MGSVFILSRQEIDILFRRNCLIDCKREKNVSKLEQFLKAIYIQSRYGNSLHSKSRSLETSFTFVKNILS